jgi:flagellar basal body-associated protein FliL
MRYIIIAMVVVALGFAALGAWALSRERPQSLVTGDFEQAQALAAKTGARLILVVDEAPPFL